MVDVSIIIPTYNRFSVLQRAVKSVLEQKGIFTRELIVADDGNIERSDEVRTFIENCGGMYLHTGGGMGGGAARNCGIERAAGAMIAFLDDDDTWEEGKLQRQLEQLHDSSIVMSYTGINIVTENGRRRYSFRKPRYDDQYRSMLKGNFIGTTSSIMVRRKVVQEIGGFDASLPALQDYDLYLRVLKRFRTGWIDEPLTVYYAHATDNKVSTSRDRFLGAVAILSRKYRDCPERYILHKTFRTIALLKCVRSRRFLFDYMKSLFKIK